jgi:hypothetical protein
MVGLERLRSLSPSKDEVLGSTTSVPILRRERIDLRVGHSRRSGEEAQVLIRALRSESIEISTMLLAKLRLGVSLSDLAKSVRTGTVDEHDLPHSV